MSFFPSRVPTTSTALTDSEKKLLKMMKKKLKVEDEDEDEDEEGKGKLPFTQISTLARVAKQQIKKDENAKIKDKEFTKEELGVQGYVYRFGCIKELQNLTQSTKQKSKSGKVPAKWTTIRLKATPIGDATHSTGSSLLSSSSGAHQDLHQDGTSSPFKLSNFNYDLDDDHDRLVDYHYQDFVKHYGELDEDEDEDEDRGCPPPPPPPRNSSIYNNSTRQQMDSSILQLKCMQAALSPAKFKAICRLMKQYRSGKIDLETFQRRQVEIFSGEKVASGTLKHFFPLCRSFCLKIPKKKNKELFKNSNVNKKVAVECNVATPDQEQLFCQKLQELIDQNIADMVGGEKKEDIQDEPLPLPPPPPPPTSTAPPKHYPKSEPPDEVPETDFASDIFQNILRLLAKVKGHDTALFLAVMETIFGAFLSGQPKTYRFYDTLAHQVIKLLEPHFSLEDDEDIQRCFGFWL